jgi:hypothetical protein
MLKKMAFEITAARKLEKMRFARGACWIRWTGIMGKGTRDSSQRKDGKEMAAMVKEVMTTG